MAHTKAQRAVKGNRDSISKRLGVKLFGGEIAHPGNVIMRQRGTKVRAGAGGLVLRGFSLITLKERGVTFFDRLGKPEVKII